MDGETVRWDGRDDDVGPDGGTSCIPVDIHRSDSWTSRSACAHVPCLNIFANPHANPRHR
eukprot:569183-Prymnesium_polylepis.3